MFIMPDFEDAIKRVKSESNEFKGEIISFSYLDSALQEVSLNKSDIVKCALFAQDAKDRHPQEYEKNLKTKVGEYYKKVVEMTAKEWKDKSRSLGDYRNDFLTLSALTSFKPLLDEQTTDGAEARIIDLEADLRGYLNAHPGELDAFLTEANAKAYGKTIEVPDFVKRDERILTLLTVASQKVIRLDRAAKADSFVIQENGEEWEFGIFGDMTMGLGDYLISVKSNKNSEKLIVLPFNRITEYLEKGEFSTVASMAAANLESEKKYTDLLAGFDLPKSDKIDYIRLSTDHFDRIVTPAVFGSAVFAEKLKQFYPNMQIETPIMSKSPKEDLMAQVEDSYSRGTRNFFIDLYYVLGLDDGCVLG